MELFDELDVDLSMEQLEAMVGGLNCSSVYCGRVWRSRE